jgi:hypothetical protein
VIMSLLVCESPRYLSSRDLLRAGCPLKLLIDVGRYTEAELLPMLRGQYKKVFSVMNGWNEFQTGNFQML